ncbi:hypothetical protein OSB04_019234 [Centaurea solstitialis]|uniref:Integrase catalytic domain-containing protein n=1 Tax=Centaurea solstitialis TaxID=347529 RepID=A0AA38T3C3_9ASTR|nr:hypothetical protein OSB04_019234 [Centaurea solstitialis]
MVDEENPFGTGSSNQSQKSYQEGTFNLSGAGIRIQTWNGDGDFSKWQFTTSAALRKNGVHPVVFAKDELHPNISDLKAREMEAWAFTTLRMVMGENVIYEIVSEKTASGIWSKLENLYLKRTLTNRLLLMRSCLFFKMKEGATIKSHMTEFEDIVMKLKTTDVLLGKDEEALAMILLYSLPEKYSHFTNSFIYGRDTLSLSDVKAGMISEDQRIQMRIGNNPGENYNQGLIATRGREDNQSTRGINRGRSQKSKTRSNCNYCHKPGHWVKDRPSLKNKDNDNTVAAADEEEVAFCAEEEEDAFCVTVTPPHADRRWVLDTGASCHMTPFRDCFATFKKLEGNSIRLGNGTSCVTQGIGAVKIKMFDGCIRTFKNVKFVPSMTRSLISVGQLSRAGCRIRIEDQNLRISRGSIILMKGKLAENSIFHLSGETLSSESCVAESSQNLDDCLWHLRLGHTSAKNLEILRKRNLIKTRVSFGVGKHNTKGILDYVHTDVWGPSSTPSLSGGKYLVSFIDDFSHKLWVYVLKLKSDVFETFKTWLAQVEVKTGKTLKVLRSDNGGEFTSGNFKDFCSSKGIHHHYTTPGDPQSNGVAERMNRTLLEKAEALNTAVHIVNRLPCSAIGGKILEEDPQPSQDPEVITTVAPTVDDVETVVSSNNPNSSTLDAVPESPAVEEVIPLVTSTSDSEEEILNDGGDQGDTITVVEPTRRSQRTTRPPNRYGDWDLANMSLQISRSLLCIRVISNKWVFKVKDDNRYKARLVAKGFAQWKGIEYDGIFAPVVRHTSIRVLLAIVAIHDLELEQLDVKTAFLYGDLEETIYMKQPDGYVSDSNPDYVCKLKKSLYGLKQSPRQWYKKFNSFMLSLGFERSENDACVYHRQSDGIFTYLLLYVDDMLIACRDPS